jgi:hypothetical protein
MCVSVRACIFVICTKDSASRLHNPILKYNIDRIQNTDISFEIFTAVFEAAYCSETSVCEHKTVRCDNTEDHKKKNSVALVR